MFFLHVLLSLTLCFSPATSPPNFSWAPANLAVWSGPGSGRAPAAGAGGAEPRPPTEHWSGGAELGP